MSLTSDLHLTDEDPELVLHPAPDGEPVAGLLRLDQRHLVDHHTGVGRHLGGPANKTYNKVRAGGVTLDQSVTQPSHQDGVCGAINYRISAFLSFSSDEDKAEPI